MNNIKRTPIFIPEVTLMNKHVHGYVYLTTNNVNNKMYIGQRKGKYNPKYLGSGTWLKNSIAKHGKDYFSNKIIDLAHSEQELNEKEKYWITFLECVESKHWYNLTEGGHSGNLCKKSRQKQITSLKQNLEFIETSRKFMIELHKDPKRKKKLIDSVKNSENVKQTLFELNSSESHKTQVRELLERLHNDPKVKEHVKNMAKENLKDENWRKSHNVNEICQVSLCGRLIKIWNTLTEIHKTGISRYQVSDCCKGRKSHAYGYKWVYLKDYERRNNQCRELICMKNYTPNL